MFDVAVFIVAVIAGAVAGVAGFGIGSLLTPLFALHFGTKLAVAIVSIPHFIATAARLVPLRHDVDRRVFWSFGVLSAAGGLAGALFQSRANGPALTLIFALLLLFAGISGLTGFAQRMRFGRRTAWVAGGVSGLFGGLVGNQGGIRSAALLGFDVSRQSFVATATAIGVVVDIARMPVYFVNERVGIMRAFAEVGIAIAGALVGTFAGVRLLRRIPERVFRAFVSIAIIVLGIYMFIKAVRTW